MRTRALLTSSLLASLLATCPAAARQQPEPRDDQASIAALIDQVEAANNAGDVERWVALFAADFVYMAPGSGPITARESLRDVARTGFRHQASIRIEPVEIQTFGDWAFARNHVAGTVRLHDSGDVVPVDVKQIVIYRKNEQGEWRIARLISNSNTP